MLNMAVIGTGAMALKHCPVLAAHPNVSPYLICSTERSRDKGDKFRQDFGFARSQTCYQEVLKDPGVDAVLICSPDHTHADFVCRALRAGKHVLCEKPLARSRAEFESLQQARRETDAVLQVGMNCRFRKPYSRAREVGLELGGLRLLRATYLLNKVAPVREGARPWWTEEGDGTFFFLHSNGVHILDLMRWFGGEVKSVFARGACLELHEFHADTFSISLEFQSGVLGELLLSLAALQPREVELRAWYDNGTIRDGKLFRRQGHEIATEPESLDLSQPVLDLHLQLDDFLRAVHTGVTPLNTLEEARANFHLIEAVEKSLLTGGVVELGGVVVKS